MTEQVLQSSRPVALRVSLPCDLQQVRPATLKVRDFLAEHGVRADEVQACELALAEACNNAVHYVAAAGQLSPIQIDVSCDVDTVEMRVRDNTPGFDWPALIELPDVDQERGRGLYLIDSLMDKARYFRSGETNCLFLTKQRQPGGATASPIAPMLEQLGQQLRESEQVISDMAEELSFCYESLSAIFRCSAELGRTHSLKDFCQRLLTDLAQITSADWFVLRLLSKDGSKLSVFTASDAGFKLPPLLLGENPPSAALELSAAWARQDIWFDAHAFFAPSDPLAFLNGASGLIHPFALGDQLIGTVAIGKAAGHPQFTAVHANVIHTFADFLGIQIANARFQEDQVHARLVSRELEIAKNIQRSLLPKALPGLPGYQLAGFCESAQQVGGDFYDVLKVDDHSVLLIIADVMGKGIPAAMFAAILRSLIRAVPEWMNQPANLLTRVNRWLFPELSGVDMFITAQLVYVDTDKRKLVAASAGHCPLLLANEQDRKVHTLSPEGMPLGILSDTSFGAQVAGLTSRSRILLYTDGLSEARNERGDFFGHERLERWFEANLSRTKTAEELKQELAAELGTFQSASNLQDDQTFLIMA